MQTLQTTYNPSFTQTSDKPSIISQFISWCNAQEKYRFGWVAAIIALHGCVLAPITVLTVAASGNSIVLWGMAIGAMAMSLISNLSAMPTKITIPVFFLSIVIDLIIVAISITNIVTS